MTQGEPAVRAHRILLPLSALAAVVHALDNGLGLTPPMGWRSWRTFGKDVSQAEMEGILTALAQPRENGTSILDLGFSDVGLDDGWQACGAGVHGSFHAANGTPTVNERFPDLEAMVEKAHELGCTAGWYANNCVCSESDFTGKGEIKTHFEGDVQALNDYGFDSVKLDHCGEFNDQDEWEKYIRRGGRTILVENCHWVGLVPRWTEDKDSLWCPFNYFRVSGDSRPDFDLMVTNLQAMPKWTEFEKPISQPGCWAYLDMLEVGNLPSFAENQAHFAAWAITSSPLILSFDLRDNAKVESMWPLISNKEIIDINQQWAGHPGTLVKSESVNMEDLLSAYAHAVECDRSDAAQLGWELRIVGMKRQVVHGDMCLDVSVAIPVGLKPCSMADPNQLFDVDASGRIMHTAFFGDTPKCLEVYGKTGPAMQLTQCYEGPPKHQRFALKDRVLADFGSPGDANFPPRCVAVREEYPLDISAHFVSWQVWAKPLADDAMAVLVLNRAANNLDAEINISEIKELFGRPTQVDEELHLRDVFKQENLGPYNGTFRTGNVPKHDSKLYVISMATGPVSKHHGFSTPEKLSVILLALLAGAGMAACWYQEKNKRSKYSLLDGGLSSDEDDMTFGERMAAGLRGESMGISISTQVGVFVVLWWTSAILVTIMVKATASTATGRSIPPFFLTFCINTTTGLFSFILASTVKGQGGPLPSPPRMQLVQIIGLGIIQGCEIGCLNKSLEFLSISERTMMQNFNVLLMMLTAQVLCLERLTCLRILAGILLVCGGMLQGWASQHQSNTETSVAHWQHIKGMLFMGSSMLLTSFKWSLIQIMTQKAPDGSYLKQMSKMQMSSRIQPITGIVCLALSFLFEFDALQDSSLYKSKQLYRVPVIATGITVIMCCELKLVEMTSAVATGVLMNLHHIPMVVAGIIFFHDTVTMESVGGFALALLGGFSYAAARYYDKAKAKVVEAGDDDEDDDDDDSAGE